MQLVYQLAATIVAILIFVGCGGGANLPAPSGTADGKFELRVLPETFAGGASGNFSFSLRAVNDGVVADVRVTNAAGLKAAYFELAYDASQLHPVSAGATGLLAATDQLATINVLSEAGVVSHGQAVLQSDNGSRFNGSGIIATIRFETGAARSVAAAPAGNGSRGEVSWNPQTQTLNWEYFNQGDYDQNGEVNAADLGPLARYFQAAGPFTPGSIQDVVDGDGNGEINIADITPIAGNFRGHAAGYNVYRSTNESDYPASGGPSTIEPVAQITFDQALGDRATERLGFSYSLGTLGPDEIAWVRSFAGGAGGGDESEGVAYGFSAGEDEGQHTLTIRVVNEPPLGSGTLADPFVMDAGVEYQIEMVDSFAGDVSLDPLSVYALDPATAGTLTNLDAILRIESTFSGAFTIHGDYGLYPAEPDLIYCVVDETGGQNIPPTASLTADVAIGDAPLDVYFDASGSTDVDGQITTFEWDFDGDGVYDLNTGDFAFAGNLYETPGTFVAGVRVTDNAGATAVADFTVIVHDPNGGENEWPVAVIIPDKTFGGPPLSVSFDGSWSYDLDGDIVEFAWDFETDGVVDSTAVSPQFTFETLGTYTVTLVVTDDFGATGEATQSIVVADSNWQVSNLGIIDAATSWPNLLAVDGQPAIAYYNEGDGFSGPFTVDYRRFNGSGWTAPVTVSGNLDATSVTDMAVVDGHPAVVFQSGGDNWGLNYVRAADSTGTDWGAPQFIDNGTYYGYGEIELVSGNPAIVYTNEDVDFNGSLRYLRALDPQGNGWGTPVVMPGTLDEYDLRPGLEILDGKPAVYFVEDFNGAVTLFTATDVNGDNWADGRFISPGYNAAATLLGGSHIPVFVTNNGEFSGPMLKFQTATDMQASDFNPGVELDSLLEQYADDYGPRIAWVDNGSGTEVPAIAYFRQDANNLEYTQVTYVQALDAQGLLWGPPQVVYSQQYGCRSIDLIAIDGVPHLTWADGFGGATYHAQPE